MTLPTDPQNTNPANPDDPFGGMDMMAWMESLAKRQGASSDELTTAANLDIPLPPADTVIDEPGYTPGYDVSSKSTAASRQAKPTLPPAPQPVAAAPVLPPAPVTPPAPVQVAPVPAAAAIDPNDPFGGMDMMAWMESLAKRQGASSDELTTAANIDIPLPPAGTVIDEPGYTPGYDVSSKSTATSQAKPTPPPPAPQPVAAAPVPPPVPVTPPAPVQATPVPAAAAVDPNDPFGGMDMMAWMESLAKRQGASSDELTTAANIDIPLPPAGTVIDEPGYTPGYDVSSKSTAASQSKPTPPPPAPQPVAAAPVPPPVPVMPSIPAESTPVLATTPGNSGDALGGMDMMAWMETLAKRQGARADELMTSANMNIPEPPANTVIDEPGYSDYSPFGGPAPVSEAMDTPNMSTADAAALLGLSDNPAEPNPLSMMNPLDWLASLAAPQVTATTDFSDFSSEQSEAMEAASALSWLEQLAHEAQDFPFPQNNNATSGPTAQATPESDIAESWVDTTPAHADELGGLSDDMATLQQWLAAQANSLAEVHDQPDAEPLAAAESDPSAFAEMGFSDATPGEIPDWLREHMSHVASNDSAVSAPALLTDSFDAPSIPTDLPDWLLENVTGSGSESSDPFFDLNAGTSSPDEFAAPARADVSDYEMNAADTLDMSSQAADPWVEAFEYEESRRQAGDEDALPDWYTEALTRSGEMVAGMLPETSQDAQPTGSADVLTPGDYPTWLTGLMDDNAETPEAVGEGQPQGSFDTTDSDQPILAGDLPSWLRDSLPDATGFDMSSIEADPFGASSADLDMADLPDWLRPAEPEPAAPVPTPAPVAPPVLAAPPAPPAPKPVTPDVRDFWGAAQSIAQTMPAAKADIPPAAPPPAPKPTPVTADHSQRLQQARALVAQGQYRESLTHYQSLVDSEAALDTVIGDMQGIVQAQPTDPGARRLLGDAHLRKGNLQDALDSYRQALDQL